MDDERPRETISGGAAQFYRNSRHAQRLRVLDDAATNVYATDAGSGLDGVSNYGEMSVNSALFDMAVVIDEDKTPIMVYRDGKPMDGALEEFFSPALWALFDKVKGRRAPGCVPEAFGFIRTQSGIAVGGVALVRQKSAGRRRRQEALSHLHPPSRMPPRSARSARPMSSADCSWSPPIATSPVRADRGYARRVARQADLDLARPRRCRVTPTCAGQVVRRSASSACSSSCC